jgi:hypothetical protein
MKCADRAPRLLVLALSAVPLPARVAGQLEVRRVAPI